MTPKQKRQLALLDKYEQHDAIARNSAMRYRRRPDTHTGTLEFKRSEKHRTLADEALEALRKSITEEA